MIVKCMMCRDGEGLIVGSVYAVIAYDDHGAYKILEEGRYLGNHINRFEVIHNDHTIYIEIEDNVGEKEYRYHRLSYPTFYSDYYSEDGESVEAYKKIVEASIEIFSLECSQEELFEFLKNEDCREEHYFILLSAFFRKANEEYIKKFSLIALNRQLRFDEDLIYVIVSNIEKYKACSEVDDLLTDLYISNTFTDKRIIEFFDNYANEKWLNDDKC